MHRSTPLLLLTLYCPCGADTGLDALRNSLASMRTTSSDAVEVCGTTPQLTIAKHQLRDWVESHLTELPENGDEAPLANKPNAQLRAAGLFCTSLQQTNNRVQSETSSVFSLNSTCTAREPS